MLDFKAQCRDRKLKKQTAEMEKSLRETEEKYASAKKTKKKADLDIKNASTDAFEREYARRILSRKKLLRFVQRFQPNYVAGWIHEDICARLERFLQAVLNGEDPRLMLFMPPRHGKSELASKKFPAWALGLYPQLEIIAASYAVSLPMGFSRAIRGQLRDPAYQKIFPDCKLNPEAQNIEGWQTTEGGMYVPAGVGSGVTGKGANILIIDDPVKDAEEADSETTRESNWDWYGSTAYTRLAPLSGVLVIQTRWHDDDLSGRCIAQMEGLLKEAGELENSLRQDLIKPGMSDAELMVAERVINRNVDQFKEEIDQWEVISYPAIATGEEYKNEDWTVTEEPKSTKSVLLREEGDALHAARFPRGRLMRIKRTLQPRHWSALYQQNPVPDEGMYFKKDMFRYVPNTVDWRGLPVYMAWDLAIGQKESNDYTVGVAGVLDYEDRLHVIDMVRARMDTFEIVEAILDMEKRFSDKAGGCVVGIEVGTLDKAIAPQMNKRMAERRQYLTFDPELKPITDKPMRARPLQGRMTQGMVLFPSPELNPWVETIQHELLRFPGGVNDDIVDALAWLARMVLHAHAPTRPKKSQPKSWKEKLNKYVRNQGKGKDGSGFMGA